jgi:hypothetical protein
MQRDPRADLWDAVKAAEAVRTFTLGRTLDQAVAQLLVVRLLLAAHKALAQPLHGALECARIEIHQPPSRPGGASSSA